MQDTQRHEENSESAEPPSGFMERRWKPRKPLTTDQLLGIANYLTYGRIAIVPVVVALMAFITNDSDSRMDRHYWNVLLSWLSMSFFVVAQISDIVDGYYARKFNVSSSFGKFVDPLADKLLSMSALIMLIPLQRIPAWIVVLLIAREVTITALRAMAASEGIEMAASDWGKKKTVIQSVAIGALLAHYPFWKIDPQRLGIFLIWATLFISVGSGIHYAWIFFREVIQEKSKQT
jgi:CDP-diacylglycerol--glycerol-3-phosphate 3-phosphatidyltransferase